MNVSDKISYYTFIKKFIILFVLFLLFTATLAFSYSNAVFSDIQKNVFRLHVIANSDSPEDQTLKYTVRDKVLEYINTSIIRESSSKEDIILLIESNIDIIQDIAQNTVYNCGYNYVVNVDIGNFEFPTKTYGDISFPAGLYDALRIKIGNASGKNWWCVMFPPLCFVDITSGIVPQASKQIMEEQISTESYNLISDDTLDINFKFKLVELFQNLNLTVSKI